MNPISTIPPIIDSTGALVDPRNFGGALSGGALGSVPTAPVNGTVGSAGSFGQALTDAVGSLSGLQDNANQAVAGLAANQGVDIHQAMLAMDQASLGMSLAVQVRDKAVESYQTLLNMQM